MPFPIPPQGNPNSPAQSPGPQTPATRLAPLSGAPETGPIKAPAPPSDRQQWQEGLNDTPIEPSSLSFALPLPENETEPEEPTDPAALAEAFRGEKGTLVYSALLGHLNPKQVTEHFTHYLNVFTAATQAAQNGDPVTIQLENNDAAHETRQEAYEISVPEGATAKERMAVARDITASFGFSSKTPVSNAVGIKAAEHLLQESAQKSGPVPIQGPAHKDYALDFALQYAGQLSPRNEEMLSAQVPQTYLPVYLPEQTAPESERAQNPVLQFLNELEQHYRELGNYTPDSGRYWHRE